MVGLWRTIGIAALAVALMAVVGAHAGLFLGRPSGGTGVTPSATITSIIASPAHTLPATVQFTFPQPPGVFSLPLTWN